MRAAFGAPAPSSFDTATAPLFEPGEAALLPAARARYVALGRQAAGQGGVVHIESLGTDAGGQRLDAWELAAARTAAIARAIGSGGVDAKRIDLSIDGTGPAASVQGQHVRVTVREPPIVFRAGGAQRRSTSAPRPWLTGSGPGCERGRARPRRADHG